MIKVSNVVKTFGNIKALDGLNMNVPNGSIYGLVGPNGSGKTTIINHLVGSYKEDSGEIKINDEYVYENNELKEKIGYIQDDLFYFNQYRIIDMARFYKNIYSKFDFEKFNKLEKIFKIDTKRKIKTLSKGMKKQVAFWLIISCNPSLIILDEPLDGLDPIMRKKVLKLLITEVEKRKVTVLVSSHNLRELEDICDTVGFMDNGKMILEKGLDEMQTDIHKVQVSFNEGVELKFSDKLNVKSIEEVGRVKKLIIKGKEEDVVREIEKLKPLFMDILPLTLEEIFIYELGGEEIETNKFFN